MAALTTILFLVLSASAAVLSYLYDQRNRALSTSQQTSGHLQERSKQLKGALTQADRIARQERARRFSLLAKEMAPTNPHATMAIALHAYDMFPCIEALDAMREGLENNYLHMPIPLGRRFLGFGPGGETVILSNDRFEPRWLEIWNILTREHTATLETTLTDIEEIRIASDGGQLIAFEEKLNDGGGRNFEVWDLSNLQKVEFRLDMVQGRQKFDLAGYWDNDTFWRLEADQLTLINLATLPTARRINLEGLLQAPRDLLWTPQTKEICTVTNSALIFWDPLNGKRTRTVTSLRLPKGKAERNTTKLSIVSVDSCNGGVASFTIDEGSTGFWNIVVRLYDNTVLYRAPDTSFQGGVPKVTQGGSSFIIFRPDPATGKEFFEKRSSLSAESPSLWTVTAWGAQESHEWQQGLCVSRKNGVEFFKLDTVQKQGWPVPIKLDDPKGAPFGGTFFAFDSFAFDYKGPFSNGWIANYSGNSWRPFELGYSRNLRFTLGRFDNDSQILVANTFLNSGLANDLSKAVLIRVLDTKADRTVLRLEDPILGFLIPNDTSSILVVRNGNREFEVWSTASGKLLTTLDADTHTGNAWGFGNQRWLAFPKQPNGNRQSVSIISLISGQHMPELSISPWTQPLFHPTLPIMIVKSLGGMWKVWNEGEVDDLTLNSAHGDKPFLLAGSPPFIAVPKERKEGGTVVHFLNLRGQEIHSPVTCPRSFRTFLATWHAPRTVETSPSIKVGDLARILKTWKGPTSPWGIPSEFWLFSSPKLQILEVKPSSSGGSNRHLIFSEDLPVSVSSAIPKRSNRLERTSALSFDGKLPIATVQVGNVIHRTPANMPAYIRAMKLALPSIRELVEWGIVEEEDCPNIEWCLSNHSTVAKAIDTLRNDKTLPALVRESAIQEAKRTDPFSFLVNKAERISENLSSPTAVQSLREQLALGHEMVAKGRCYSTLEGLRFCVAEACLCWHEKDYATIIDKVIPRAKSDLLNEKGSSFLLPATRTLLTIWVRALIKLSRVDEAMKVIAEADEKLNKKGWRELRTELQALITAVKRSERH